MGINRLVITTDYRLQSEYLRIIKLILSKTANKNNSGTEGDLLFEHKEETGPTTSPVCTWHLSYNQLDHGNKHWLGYGLMSIDASSLLA